MSKEILDLKVLGIKIGTHTGWDQADTMVLNFYGFQSVNEEAIPSCETIFIDYDSGEIKGYLDGVDEAYYTVNAFDVLKALEPK